MTSLVNGRQQGKQQRRQDGSLALRAAGSFAWLEIQTHRHTRATSFPFCFTINNHDFPMFIYCSISVKAFCVAVFFQVGGRGSHKAQFQSVYCLYRVVEMYGQAVVSAMLIEAGVFQRADQEQH